MSDKQTLPPQHQEQQPGVEDEMHAEAMTGQPGGLLGK